MRGTLRARQTLSLVLAVLLLGPNLYAARTELKPGWNMFSLQDDVTLGEQAAQDAEKQLPMLNKPEVDDYLNQLGKRLAKYAPGYAFPYQFKAVNQAEINAFALPGGYIYVNRGTIEAAENEAQLAGVIAHEISHVALRHGTNQLTKAQFAQLGLGALGGLLGGGAASTIAALGSQLGATFLFMKFSRTAETQADVMGTQILYDAGYDPQAMAEFFKAIEKQGGSRPPQFFSSHPNPENREGRIEEEIQELGTLKDPKRDSEDFHVIKSYLQSLPPAPKQGEQQQQAETEQIEQRPELPARQYEGYRHPAFTVRYPSNWEVYESGTQVLFAPKGGVVGNSIAYGAMLNAVEIDDQRMSLEEATNRLVQGMIQSNAGMQQVSQERARLGRRRALATQLSGQSPFQGEREVDWVFTVRLPQGLFYAVFTVPESDYRNYQRTFQDMLDSVRFR